MADTPRVFISWSGEHAQLVAEAMAEWFRQCYDRIDPFFSPISIDAGRRGLSEIDNAIRSCVAAVVVVTRESMTSPWVNYEVGAIAVALGEQERVIPVLVDIQDPTDVEGPLIQFQAVTTTAKGIEDLLKSLNTAMDIPESKAARTMATEWLDLSEKLMEIEMIVEAPRPYNPVRKDRDLLEEVLEIARRIENQSGSMAIAVGPERKFSKPESGQGRVMLDVHAIPTVHSVGMDLSNEVFSVDIVLTEDATDDDVEAVVSTVIHGPWGSEKRDTVRILNQTEDVLRVMHPLEDNLGWQITGNGR